MSKFQLIPEETVRRVQSLRERVNQKIEAEAADKAALPSLDTIEVSIQAAVDVVAKEPSD